MVDEEEEEEKHAYIPVMAKKARLSLKMQMKMKIEDMWVGLVGVLLSRNLRICGGRRLHKPGIVPMISLGGPHNEVK